MSAVAVPPTKPFSARPPIVPPSVTGFDGDSGHEGEQPYYKVLIEDVRGLLRTCARLPFTFSIVDLDTILRLIDQRKRWLQLELDTQRLLNPEIVPPPIMAEFAPDSVWDENDVAQTYVRLLSELDSAADRIKTEFRAKNLSLPTSQD